MIIGYCVKCRKKKQMKNLKTMKAKGRKYIQGICKKCGTKMSVFVK